MSRSTRVVDDPDVWGVVDDWAASVVARSRLAGWWRTQCRLEREDATLRRYAWRGPAFAPVLLEIRTTPEATTLEAWWEDVWAAWPTIGQRRPPPRRLTATAQINRLLQALDQPPLAGSGDSGRE